MTKYVHKVNYYETDKMGITHHSNYIRFMEEARMDYLSQVGFPMTRLESAGITSPVVSVNCDYKHTTTYSDEIEIEVTVIGYTGVRLTLAYVMKNKATDVLVATATSVHCFINQDGKPIPLKKQFPELDSILREPCNSLNPQQLGELIQHDGLAVFIEELVDAEKQHKKMKVN